MRVAFLQDRSGVLALHVATPEVCRQLALSVSGALAIWGRKQPDFDLVALDGEPRASLKELDLQELLQGTPSESLRSGSVLTRPDLEHLPQGIHAFAKRPELREAICGLDLSDTWVEMGLGPFHYFVEDMESMSKADLEADHLVNRHRYQLTYVSAFKGIESLLGGRQFKKHEVRSRLEAAYIDPALIYTPLVERGARPTTIEDAVKRCLRRRNAAAAHGKRAPAADDLRITLDVVAEARALLLTLFQEALGPPVKSELPTEAFLP